MRNKLIRIKRFYTVLSFIIFCSMLSYGIIKIDLDINLSPLSIFGINSETINIWIFTLLIISFELFLNSLIMVIEMNLKYRKINFITFSLSLISLVGISFINMRDSHNIHNILAMLFFLLYSSSIFLIGIQLIKSDLRIAILSILVSIAMLTNFAWLMIHIHAVPEITFIILCFLWNFIMISQIKKSNV